MVLRTGRQAVLKPHGREVGDYLPLREQHQRVALSQNIREFPLGPFRCRDISTMIGTFNGDSPEPRRELAIADATSKARRQRAVAAPPIRQRGPNTLVASGLRSEMEVCHGEQSLCNGLLGSVREDIDGRRPELAEYFV